MNRLYINKDWSTLKKLLAMNAASGGATPKTETLSGSIVTFSTTKAVPLIDCKADINPVQTGSGDPSPENVRPITGWTGAKVTRTGINIWDEEWEAGAIGVDTGQNTTETNRIRSKNYILADEDTTYGFAFPSRASVSTGNIRMFFYDKNKAYLSYRNWLTQGQTFTTPANTAYMRFYTNGSYGETYANDISINYPATATSYEPYSGTTYSITFPTEAGTVYGGRLDVTNGVLTVDRRYIDSSEIDSATGNKITAANPQHGIWVYRVNDAEDTAANIINTKLLSNILPVNHQIYLNNGGNGGRIGCAIWWTNQIGIATNDTTVNTSELFRQWCVDNSLQIVYPLSTPITYQLTPQEITSLIGTNNVWADTGDVTVTYYK